MTNLTLPLSSNLKSLITGLILASLITAGLLAAEPAPFVQGFEDANSLSNMTVQGNVAIKRGDGFKGNLALSLTRAKEAVDKQPTEVVTPSFPVGEGIWDLGAAMTSNLTSPDSSYNGSARFEVLDATGKSLEKIELGVISGKSAWKTFRKRVELPPDAASARFVVTMEKSFGEFAVDELCAVYVGPSLRTVKAIKFASKATGNLFMPDQPLRFDVTAESTKPRPEGARAVTCTITDYWGAEYTAPIRVELPAEGSAPKGLITYSGVLDLSDLKLEPGKYFEIHAEMSEPAMPEPARDTSTFAVLPLAATKAYKPFDIPFTASGWNPGASGFFHLSDRLGLRVANVYSGWSPKEPYESKAPGIEIVKELGMGALMSTPVIGVERNPNSPYTETSLREGARRMVEKYSKELPIAIRVGNEPPSISDEDVQRIIKAYKAVYEGVKAADPSVIVTSTSCGVEEIYFRNNFQPWHDVFDFHAYADHKAVPEIFANYEKMVEEFGQRKPVWTTEIGLNSEGMARSAVASQMIKIFSTFFAQGGANLSWFGINWPDPEGKNVGTNGDSFDVFNGKYSLFSPRLTAITEYNMVNGICVKKVVDQKVYPGEITLILFRDSSNRCLLVAWKDSGQTEVFLPLPGVSAVRAIRLDGGSSQLDAGGKGLTLGLSTDPYLLELNSADLKLPTELGAGQVTVSSPITQIVKGGTSSIALSCAGVDPQTISWVTPPRWTVQPWASTEKDVAVYKITAPDSTSATEGRLLVQVGKSGEIPINLPVVDPLDVRFMPVPSSNAADGISMGLRVINRGKTPQQFRWKISIPECIPMVGGLLRLNEPQPFTPAFTTPHEGDQTLAPGATAELAVRASNFDPHSLYRACLELLVNGKTISQERLFGGCPSVPKVNGGVAFDGKLGDPKWKMAPIMTLDQPNQFAVVTKKTAKWDGPEDLSGTMRMLWDDNYLYIGMTVQDDIFRAPEIDGNIWRGDGLQFLVDPCRDAENKPGKYDYCVALSPKGPQAWCSFTADPTKATSGEAKDFLLKITPTGEKGGMIYEVAIPWSRLSPFVPAPGADLGLAMIINEDDGEIRDSFMTWFGCAHSKQLSMNGDVLLLGEKPEATVIEKPKTR